MLRCFSNSYKPSQQLWTPEPTIHFRPCSLPLRIGTTIPVPSAAHCVERADECERDRSCRVLRVGSGAFGSVPERCNGPPGR